MSSCGAKEIASDLKVQARELGFALVGIAPAVTPERLNEFYQWLESGFAGDMHYLERRKEAYSHPSSILDGCKSVVMLAMPYLFDQRQREPQTALVGTGMVARYAQCGEDYHDRIRAKLRLLKRWLQQQCPGATVRGVVDTAPLHEREFATRAGLGWIGKNTLLINKQWGSYFFLAALLIDMELPPDQPHNTSHCGTCTACLQACPTQAFIKPYMMDARRCLSYITIESRGVPETTIAGVDNQWMFGCDICQEVCPWNRRSLCSTDESWKPQEPFVQLDLLQTLNLDSQSFEQHYRHTPLWRSGRVGMVRNAILLAGAQRYLQSEQSLINLLADDSTQLRQSAAWALGKLATERGWAALRLAQQSETDHQVRLAVDQALCSMGASER